MSDEQQQAALGRAMEDYVASKKKLAALQQEANRFTTVFTPLIQTLSGLAQAPGRVDQYFAQMAQQTRDLPTGESLRALALEIKAEYERKSQLHRALKDVGFEPKE